MFHDEIINFRKLEPKKFSMLYDTVQTSFSVYQLVHSNLIGENCANLLGVKETELSVTEGMVRMDVPHDKRNIAGWHQEISYLRNEGLVVWIPLTDITIKLGLLEICPKSHLEGELKIEKILINNKLDTITKYFKLIFSDSNLFLTRIAEEEKLNGF